MIRICGHEKEFFSFSLSKSYCSNTYYKSFVKMASSCKKALSAARINIYVFSSFLNTCFFIRNLDQHLVLKVS